MELAVLYAFGSVIAVSLVSLVGLFTLSVREDLLRRGVFLLVALAIGALLGDAFLHLISESFEEGNDPTLVSLLIIAGIFSFFALEKLLKWHHHDHSLDEARHEHDAINPVGKLVLVADGLHNFFDGIIIGASYLVSVPVGIASTIAIVLHEIPQEIGDFGVLLYAGYSKRRALFLNFISALLAILGAAVVLIVGIRAEDIISLVLPFAAGIFIYIAASDLVPELHKRHGLKSAVAEILMVLVGVGAMYAILFLE